MKRCCPTSSILRGVSPETGLINALIFVVSIFMFRAFPKCTITAVFLTTVVVLSGIPIGFVFGKLGTVIVLLVVAIMFGVFLAPKGIL